MASDLPTRDSSAASTLSLRRAGPGDAALIAEMHARSRASAYRGLLTDQYLDQVALTEGLAHWPVKLQELADGAGEVLIAEREGAGQPERRAIGFVCMLAPDSQHGVYIDNLHTLPEHKGSGAGTALLEAARRWAIERGATHLHLRVLDANAAAIGFYESRGWQFTGTMDDTMGGSPVVARLYALPLEPAPLVHTPRRRA